MLREKRKNTFPSRELCFVTRAFLETERTYESNHDAAAGTPSLLNRRGVLRLLTFTGASLLAGGQNSQAFMDFFSSYGEATPETLRKLNIPVEWTRQLGPTLPAYVAFLQKQNLRYLTVRQVLQPHTHVRGKVSNTLPPRSLWPNVRATLRVIDMLVPRLDSPIEKVVSVYRSPTYNARCPGAKSNSYHTRNNAVDIVFDCAPGKVAAMARAMRAAGLYKGGVGRYRGFTHIDTRGSNADW
jgi:hypothetical protein